MISSVGSRATRALLTNKIKDRSISLLPAYQGSCFSSRSQHNPTLKRVLSTTPAEPNSGEPLSIPNIIRKWRQHDPQSGEVVRFRDLQQFIRTKSTIDDAHVRQMIMSNQYRPIRYLGKGSFGKVFLCSSDEEPDKLFAIKVLNVERDRREYNWTWLTAEERQQSKSDAKKVREFIESLEPGLIKDHMLRAEEMMLNTMKREENPLLRRIRRPVAEREILVRIGPHPFVANLLGSFRDNRFMFLVSEYFPCGNLQQLIDQTKMTPSMACFFGAQLVLGLQFLQTKNVAHRDVKPTNILLSQEGFIALADFGLATRLRGGLKTFCGTAEYIAPEVLSEKMWSASGLDMWAFGITLYQLLVGKTPFEAPDATSVFLNTLTSPPKFPEYLSDDAKDLLSKILAKNASGRPSWEDVKRHPFFASINWDKLLEKDVSVIPPELKPMLEKLVESNNVAGNFLSDQQHSNAAVAHGHIIRFDSLLK